MSIVFLERKVRGKEGRERKWEGRRKRGKKMLTSLKKNSSEHTITPESPCFLFLSAH